MCCLADPIPAKPIMSVGFGPRSTLEMAGYTRLSSLTTSASCWMLLTISILDISHRGPNMPTTGEMSRDLMEEMRAASGAILFVRVNSEADVRPLDWVTSKQLLAKLGNTDDKGMPTQVMLSELLRFLEETQSERANGNLPRVSVVVTAWDLVDTKTFANGPQRWLEREYPLLAGRLDASHSRDLRIFGLTIVGSNLLT